MESKMKQKNSNFVKMVKRNMIYSVSLKHIKPFHATGLFLYSLKTLEPGVSWGFLIFLYSLKTLETGVLWGIERDQWHEIG